MNKLTRFTIIDELACSVPLYRETYDGSEIKVSHTEKESGLVDIHFDGPADLLEAAISDCGFTHEDIADGTITVREN